MHKKGKTVSFADPPVITGHAGVAGKKEGEGPMVVSANTASKAPWAATFRSRRPA